MDRKSSFFLLSLAVIVLAILYSHNASDEIGGYITVYSGYSHNLDYNYFHIQEFINEHPDYFSIIPPDSITPCIDAFRETYYINNTMIQQIQSQENVVSIHPVFIFSISGKDHENNTIGLDVVAVEPSIMEVYENDALDGRFLREGEEGKVVVNRFMKYKYGFDVGDSVQFFNDFYWKQEYFEVVGVLDEQFPMLGGDSAQVIMSSKKLFNMLNVSGDEELYNLLYICTRNPVQALNQDELVTYLNSVFPEALISSRNLQSK